MNSTNQTHVNEIKKAKVKELAGQLTRKTVMVISIKELPSAQFQDIKKKLKSKAKIQVVKKSLVNFALDHSGVKELKNLVPYVGDSTAMLFSDDDAFEISGILADEKSPSKAKAGQIAPCDIEVKAGPTDLLPGPDISALSSVGLIPKVENGKIAVQQDKVIAKKGVVITENLASIMSKLDIIPFEVGIEPIAAYMDKKVYVDIKIDKKAMIKSIEEAFSQALAFAVEISYPTKDTIDFIIGKAAIEGNAIDIIIDNNAEGEKSEKEKTAEGNKSEEIADEEKATEDETKEINTEEVKAEEAVTKSE